MTLYTEDEALKKWCPYVRKAYLNGELFHGTPTCIAAECMAWRFGKDENPQFQKAKGYCGAFGRPE